LHVQSKVLVFDYGSPTTSERSELIVGDGLDECLAGFGVLAHDADWDVKEFCVRL
jgi:hypothetical protein